MAIPISFAIRIYLKKIGALIWITKKTEINHQDAVRITPGLGGLIGVFTGFY